MQRKNSHPTIAVPTDPAILGYMAGIIDGEGNLGINSAFSQANSRNTSHAARLTITNTNITLMHWLVANVGGGYRTRKSAAGKTGTPWSRCYQWNLFSSNLYLLLDALLPYLVLKREQAEIILALRELQLFRGRTIPPEVLAARTALKDRIQALNGYQGSKRQPVATP